MKDIQELKEKNPEIKGILADPEGSTMGGGEHHDYNIEGIGNDFIAATMDMSLVDDVIKITDTEAFEKSLKYRNSDPYTFRQHIRQTKTGDIFELSTEVKLRVIYPENCETGGNAGSLVIILEVCGKTILFTGDIGSDTEELLVSEGLIQDIDLLKVSHHGSKYSSSNSFLERAKPERSVIQVSKNNMYGHPSPSTLERLNNAGSEIFRTDLDGAVIFEYY